MEADERPIKKQRLSTEESTTTGANGTWSRSTSKTGNGIEGADSPRSESQNGIDSEANDMDDHVEDLPDSSNEHHLPAPATTAPLADALLADPNHPPISKNQQKKLRKKAEWESKREERKTVRKEKAIAKRTRRREARQAHEAENLALGLPAPPPKKRLPQRPVTLPVTILIDCDFDDLMRDNERISLAAQVTRSYSDNKNALFRAHLGICSFGGRLRERFENVLGHYRQWRGVRFVQENFVDAAGMAEGWMREDKDARTLKGAFADLSEGKEVPDDARIAKLQADAETIYLTSESEYTLDRLKPYSTYIIGGLVDKNREKGICYKRATEAGVKTARLPIGEFMDMQSRKVLATNHVNEIMVRWLECGDWGEAFLRVIPKRKGGRLREGGEGAGVGEEEEGTDVDVDADADAETDAHAIVSGHADGVTRAAEFDGGVHATNGDLGTADINHANSDKVDADEANGISQVTETNS